MDLTPLPTLLSINNLTISRKMFPSSRIVKKDHYHLSSSLPRHHQMIVRRSQDLPSYSICGNLNPQSQLRQDDGCVPVYPPEPPPAHQISPSLTPASPLAHRLCLSAR